MLRRRKSFVAVPALILGAALLCPVVATAQHQGGAGSSGGGIHGSVSGSNLPTGIDEKDPLKDFHLALAVQATGPQITEFQALVKSTEAAKATLQALLQAQGADSAEFARRGAVLDQALEKARSDNKTFVDGFTPVQKNGLKEMLKRLAKADSDVAQEKGKVDQAMAVAKPGPDFTAVVQSLDKVLADFSNQQLAVGREMSIILASGQDLTFSIPQVNRPVNIANRTIAVTVSGALSQTAAENGQRTFRLALTTNLSDLQQNITELLRAQFDRSELCGQRVAIREARLTPATPASLLMVRLHFERWTCTRMMGQQTANELAEGDGTVEMKLIPSVGPSNALLLNTELRRVDANGMLAESLRSGSLGDDLREKVSESVLAAMRAGADFKTALPLAVQNFATMQSAKFQDVGAGDLTVIVGGQVQISNEQANQLATQLNQALSAQGSPSR